MVSLALLWGAFLWESLLWDAALASHLATSSILGPSTVPSQHLRQSNPLKEIYP